MIPLLPPLRSLFYTALLALVGAAAALEAPERIEAEPGAFVSVPVEREADGELEVVAPPFLTLVGAPATSGGRGLVNLLVAPDAPAGRATVTIRAGGAEDTAETAVETAETVVGIVIARVRGVAVTAPDEATLVRGEEGRLEAVVTNEGNAAERVELSLAGGFEGRVEPPALVLAVGERATVAVVLTPERAGGGTLRLRAEPTGAPAAAREAFVRLSVLAFAGADAIEGPRLDYALRLGAGYGSDGLGYGVEGSLSGQLSDAVDASAATDVEREQDPFASLGELLPEVSGSATLAGEAWSVGYRGAAGSHTLLGGYGPVNGVATLGPESWQLGASYREDGLEVRLRHRQGEGDAQRLEVGYAARPLPELELVPFVGAARVADPGAEVDLDAVAGVDARFDTALAVGNARLETDAALESWSVTVAGASRSLEPLAVSAGASLGPLGGGAYVSLRERVSDELTLQQSATWSGAFGVTLGASYAPAALPLTLGASVGSRLDGGPFTVDYATSATVRLEPVTVSGFVRGGDAFAWGAEATVREGPFDAAAWLEVEEAAAWGAEAGWDFGPAELRVGYRRAGEGGPQDEVAAAVRGELGRWRGAARYRDDLGSSAFELGGEVGYAFPQGHTLAGSVAIDEQLGVAWRLGASYLLRGGFATPDGVVDAFGGRSVGILAGRVFHDLDRDGERGADEPELPQVAVRLGDETSAPALEGGYRVAAPPGEYRVRLAGLSATQALAAPLEVTLERNETTALDVPVVTVATLLGTVVDDLDRDGARGEDERPLGLVGVELRGPDGATLRTRSSGDGSFFFQRLPPGEYTVALVPSELPRRYEATGEPLAVTLAAGPSPRVVLGATARAKELVTTLAADDLALGVEVSPNPAPPGADALVRVRVRGGPADLVADAGAGATPLREVEPGVYEGRVAVPESAVGVAQVDVRAEAGGAAAEQRVMLIVQPGPLARLATTPSLASPGQTVRVEATLLRRAERAVVSVDGQRIDLAPDPADPYRFAGTFRAPEAEGSFGLALHLGDDAAAGAAASTNLRVVGGAPSAPDAPGD